MPLGDIILATVPSKTAGRKGIPGTDLYMSPHGPRTHGFHMDARTLVTFKRMPRMCL